MKKFLSKSFDDNYQRNVFGYQMKWSTKHKPRTNQSLPFTTEGRRIKNSLANGKDVIDLGAKYDYVRGIEGVNYTKKEEYDIVTLKDLKQKTPFVPVKTTVINGHRFEHHNKPTWCDMCEDFIWGLYTQAVRCQYCRYTCHAKCVTLVDLECPKKPTTEKSREELTKETLEILNDVTDGAATLKRKNNNLPNYVSSISQLSKLIKEYNKESSLIMTLHEDYTFDGFIRVHMNLSRPVNVSSDVSNLTLKKAVAKNKSMNRKSISDVFNIDTNIKRRTSTSDDSGIGSQSSTASSTIFANDPATLIPTGSRKGRRPSRRLSFYMPKGTYKPLHVTSKTTAREVIEALLAKYNVTDNPKKFALYEKRTNEAPGSREKEVMYRRIPDEENPLVLCLSWGASKDGSPTFALKENEDGKVQWEYFELPELNNFLKILQLEEDELIAGVMQKYENYREELCKALESKSPESTGT
ncbi:ras association domain-containing protein 1-like isoform X2 [Clytia hemisphaerica]|uniref:ras association domain-containing protein 1-like isoform X2 n=1 Tax=Clytia hemisphaerica TaxID=252671 RepID=UPI0034D3FA2B